MTALIIYGLLSGLADANRDRHRRQRLCLALSALFVYRELPWRALPRILTDSAISSAAILVLVGFANVFGWILVSEHIPQAIANAVLSLTGEQISDHSLHQRVAALYLHVHGDHRSPHHSLRAAPVAGNGSGD